VSRHPYILLLCALGLVLCCGRPDPPLPRGKILSRTPWPVYRGDPALSGVATDPLPGEVSLRWTFATGGSIVSTPVVDHSHVYVSSTDGHVYALSLLDGSESWRFHAEDAFEASPLLLGDSLYIGALDGSFFALEVATGRVRWKASLQSGIYGSANWAAAPDHSEKLILFGGYDNTLYCYGAESGERKWTYETGNHINGTPAVEGRRLVFGGCDEQLRILDVSDGSLAGQVDLGSYIPGSAGIADQRAYVGHYGDAAACVSLSNHRIVWEYRDPAGGGPFFSSPAIGKDRVVVGSRDNKLHCIDRASGRQMWTFRTRDTVDSSPVIAGESVVFGSSDGRLYAVDLATGREQWSYEIGEALTGSPALFGGDVYIGAEDGTVYAFGGVE